MGLAEPRKRLKLSKDPNNTQWTRDTTSFGHKIMTSQGWAPGQYLGAIDAPHAEFHTEANASHIRVMLKDDNLGIGAKKGSGVGQGECVGLDVFQTLLGRLNATDEEEFEREQRSREDLKRAIYTERKWGSIRFVSGGFLIGDKIQDLIDGEAERIRRLGAADSRGSSDSSSDTDSDSGSESETTPEPVVVKQKKSKKSKKVVEIDIETSTVVLEAESSSKSKSKKKRKLAEAEADEAVEEKKSKKSKKSKKEKSSKSDDSEAKHSKKSKKEKRSKKEKKSEDDDTSKSSKSKSKRSRDDAEPTPAVLAAPTPAAAAAPRPILLGGRHAVRARNIEQKRLAAVHSASLNEIFMIKS